jgi:hypothetical protein
VTGGENREISILDNIPVGYERETNDSPSDWVIFRNTVDNIDSMFVLCFSMPDDYSDAPLILYLFLFFTTNDYSIEELFA